jgi:SpoVK/Ycf46/Vps4 family AAA+-type ATPase
VRRKLRSLANRLTATQATVVALTPTSELPQELADEAVRVDLPLPDVTAMRLLLDHLVTAQPAVRCRLGETGLDTMARACLGLTAAQAQRALVRTLARHPELDERAIQAVLAEKRAVVRATPGLDFLPIEQGPDEVGGLEHLKEWLALRAGAFSSEAAAFGLPTPKGVALIGIPGSGKSLTARMVGRTWQLPVLRLDMGSLFSSKLGESEQRIVRALGVAEAVSPSVLWIDEVEKVLSHGDQDGGTSLRVLGTMLTWMQERRAPVFVVATANDVSSIPPELLRRGRFDEVFFLDLPTEAERAEILRVQLRRRGRDPDGFDVATLARLAEGHVGAELEQAVTEGLYRAFAEGRELQTDDVGTAITQTVPLSRSSRERVAELRAWLREGRARPASAAPYHPDPSLRLA